MMDNFDENRRANNRLALLIFIATLLGTLIGVAADLTDASGLIVPVVHALDPSPRLRLVGSSTILGEGIQVAQEWREEFLKRTAYQSHVWLIGEVDRTIRFDIESVGTLKGIDLILGGKGQILAASEPLSEENQKRLLQEGGLRLTCAAEIGYDVIMFVTEPNNTIPPLTTRQMSDILVGKTTNWNALGGMDKAIKLIIRPGSGTTDIVMQRFTDASDLPKGAITCAGNDECLDKALSTPGSLYWVSVAWLNTKLELARQQAEKKANKDAPAARFLNPILITNPLGEMANPLQDDFQLDKYPRDLIRPLYLYVVSGPQIKERELILAKEFIYYVRSFHGQGILQRHGFFTFFKPPAGIQVGTELPEGFMTPDSIPVICLDH